MKQMVIKRTFSAPIADVWRGWTDEEQLKQWWSPEGMSCSHFEMDLREGGRFTYCFKSNEDGTEYWGRGEIQRLDEPNAFVYTDCFTDEDGNDVAPSHYGIPGDEIMESGVEVALEENGDQTKLTMTMDNPFDDSMTEMMEDGWNGMLDKLAAILR